MKKTALINFLLVISILYVFPLLLANLFYADDITRVIDGHYWEHDNRLISNEITRILSFDSKIKDFFPFTTIFSALILCISGFLISEILDLEKDRTFKISPLLFLTSPFMIENLAFRFDSPFMALSVIGGILPFYGNLKENKFKFFLVSLVSVLLIMLTYQASISIFIIMTLLVSAQLLYTEKPNKVIWVILNGFLSVILGYVIYKIVLVVSNSPSLGRDKFFIFSDRPIEKLKYNISCVYQLIKQVFNPHFFTASLVLLIAFCYGIFKLLKAKIKAISKIIIIAFILLIPILVPLPLIILDKTYINPRVMIGFSLIIYGMLFLVNKYSQKTTTYISLFFVVIAFPLMSTFSNLLKEHENFQKTIVHDITSKTDLNGKNIVFDGQIPWSLYSENLIYGYEYINYLHATFLGNQNFGLEEFFIYQSKNLYTLTFLRDNGREELLKRKLAIPVIYKTNYYIVRSDDKNVIVDFNKVNLFIPQPIIIKTESSENVIAYFDIANHQGNSLDIRGWCVIEGMNSSKNKVKLLLIGNNELTYSSELVKEKRNDISEALNGSYNDSGFRGILDISSLQNGEYTLGIFIENEVENKILIKENKIVVNNSN